jgi:preprotein translocase subunit SecA
MREYQGVKMSWAELDRVVSEEILRDDDIRRRVAESGRPLRSHATGMSEHVAGRLADICGGTGRPDEAREFRQQAEKDRQRAGQRVPRATAWAAPTASAGESRAAKRWAAPAGKTGRNQPCPCGSGKKFKKCCGAPASA